MRVVDERAGKKTNKTCATTAQTDFFVDLWELPIARSTLSKGRRNVSLDRAASAKPVNIGDVVCLSADLSVGSDNFDRK